MVWYRKKVKKLLLFLTISAKEEEKRVPGLTPKSAPVVAAAHTKTKDDAYDQFMREMEDLI